VTQALVGNVGTCRPAAKGEIQVGGPHEGERTEAGHRGGVTRRSAKGPVMGLERRGDRVWLYQWVNLQGEEPDGYGKTV
jgi:hypothetical protein